MNKKTITEFIKLFDDACYQTTMGYAETQSAKSLVVYPKTVEDCQKTLKFCNKEGIQICCRGGGYSYGDMILNSEQVILDTTQMNQILDWDPESGLIRTQPGVSFASVFKYSLLHNWTLLSCPGGMDVTIGGAISNNVHGKDAWKNGNFGNQVHSFKLLLANGDIINVDKSNEQLFKGVIGGMGLLGIIIEATLQLKKIPSPFVRTSTTLVNNIEESIEILDSKKNDSDFLVAWVDAFSSGSTLGRGYVSSASWIETKKLTNTSALEKSLQKPSLIFGVLPAKPIWFIGRPFFRPLAINVLNRIHYSVSKLQQTFYSETSDPVLFTDYNFMHNKIPDIRTVYRPHGFFEFEPLIPKKNGSKTIRELLELCQRYNSESLLCGIKAHKADDFLISFEGEGYSVGVDIQCAGRTKNNIRKFAKAIFEFTTSHKGKIYLAKDDNLDKSTFQTMYPEYLQFLNLKKQYDPLERFSSNMYQRLMRS